jgi:hypothetical protein
MLPVLAEWMGHSYRPRRRRRPIPLWTLLAVGLLLGVAGILARGWQSHPATAPAVKPTPSVQLSYVPPWEPR